MTYSITHEDIDAYLDSKADDEVIGVTCDGEHCLVAQVFRMKYPGTRVIVGPFSFSIYPYRGVKWEDMFTPEEIALIVHAFDQLAGESEDEYEEAWPVTKREWLEAQVRA